jgi:excisionase family DNA binding protein
MEGVMPERAAEPSVLNPKWQKHDAFSVAEAAEILRVSKEALYDELKRGRLPAVRVGDRWIIPRRALERLLGA